jgi:hypothetical protein
MPNLMSAVDPSCKWDFVSSVNRVDTDGGGVENASNYQKSPLSRLSSLSGHVKTGIKDDDDSIIDGAGTVDGGGGTGS